MLVTEPPAAPVLTAHHEDIVAMMETSAISSTSLGSRPANASEAIASASVSNVSNSRPLAVSTMVKRGSDTGTPR